MIEEVLIKRGGMLSTELKELLIKACNVTDDTARKRISRAEKSNPNICKLKGLNFKNRAVFYYHKRCFGSPMYWHDLCVALLQTKSAYGYALSAIVNRDKAIPVELFPIHSGVPARMAKNLSYERVLADLKVVNVLTELTIPKVGDCIALVQDTTYLQNIGESIKARLLAEDILIKALGSWLKKLNIASYKKLAFGRSENRQMVNGFFWDISAPSYIVPLISYTPDSVKPGFIVCDVSLGNKVTETTISPFLNKVKKSQFSNKQGKCMYMLVAEEFTEEAFSLAKKAGVIPATTRNLFGKEVEETLKSVISVFSHLASFIDTPEQITELFSRLDKIEGAVGNLRGTLFEFIIAESLRHLYPNIELGKKLKSTTDNKKYDADIMVTKPYETLVIECKSGYPNTQLAHEQVERWLHEQVPNMYRTLSNEGGSNKTFRFELWSTKTLKHESIELIQKVSNQTKKYHVDFKISDDIRHEVSESNRPELINLLDQHFLKHPLNEI